MTRPVPVDVYFRGVERYNYLSAFRGSQLDSGPPRDWGPGPPPPETAFCLGPPAAVAWAIGRATERENNQKQLWKEALDSLKKEHRAAALNFGETGQHRYRNRADKKKEQLQEMKTAMARRLDGRCVLGPVLGDGRSYGSVCFPCDPLDANQGGAPTRKSVYLLRLQQYANGG